MPPTSTVALPRPSALSAGSAIGLSAAVATVTLFFSTVLPVMAAASTTPAARIAGATNGARSDHDLRPYASYDDLNAIARRWAAHMAAARTLAHNPRLGQDVHGWRAVGENVGVGETAAGVQSAFMHSSAHRTNILSRTYRQFGVGAVRGSDGRLYVDVVFRNPS